MKRYLLITIAGLAVLATTVAVIAGYPGRFAASPPKTLNITAGQALQELHRHNYNSGQLFMEGIIELFGKKGRTGAAEETLPFKYYVQGENHYQQFGTVEMIRNSDYSLYVNHEKQLIQVATSGDMPGTQLFSQASLIDSLIREERIDAEVQQAPNGGYVIKATAAPGEAISEYRIYYSPAGYAISRIEMDMYTPANDLVEEPVEKQLVVINYHRFDKQPANEKDLFSEKKFIRKHRKKPELTNEFSGYQLINLIPDK